MNCHHTPDKAAISRLCGAFIADLLNIKFRFFLLFLFSALSFQAAATGIWVSQNDKFGANFPETPIRLDAATKDTTGYAYQSYKIFENGGALYSITVVTIPPEITSNKINKHLQDLNAEFIKTMGQRPASAKVTMGKFGDGRSRLDYEFDFQHDGIPFKAHGYWLNDKKRIIRVSVAYTKNLKTRDAQIVLLFLDSFVLIAD